jgi:DNA-binding transcriptional MerR regulator
MQSKTTRAFRTISEAGEELGLQPHVLRFWESKFSQIKPIKRGGGRRFYRPEDIEFLRGIKILLHDEGHPIKDVQKLIRLKGPGRVMELGQSVEKAARDKEVKDTVLVPERIRKSSPPIRPSKSTSAPEPVPVPEPVQEVTPPVVEPTPEPVYVPEPVAEAPQPAEPIVKPVIETGMTEAEKAQHRQDLEEALERLKSLKSRWSSFTNKAS